jgi:hypothetical protein
MTKLIVAFRNFVNTPENFVVLVSEAQRDATPEEDSLFGHLLFVRLNWKWQVNRNSLKVCKRPVGANGELDIKTCFREIYVLKREPARMVCGRAF